MDVQLTAQGAGFLRAVVPRSASAHMDIGRWHAGLTTTAHKVVIGCARVVPYPGAATLELVQVARVARVHAGKHRASDNKMRLILIA
jgi:hypothetical protein